MHGARGVEHVQVRGGALHDGALGGTALRVEAIANVVAPPVVAA